MIIRDLMPMTAPQGLARTPQEANEALQVHAAGTLLGLVDGPRFLGLGILREALLDVGWGLDASPFFEDGNRIVYKATVIGHKGDTVGWKFSMLLVEQDGIVHVLGALISKFGENADPGLEKAYRALLAEKKD
jgi:hypothetical protein